MTGRRSPQKRRGARSDSDVLVDGLFGGHDWTRLHSVVREGVERGAFGAPTVTRFLARATEDESIRRQLRDAVVAGRSWKRRVDDRSPLSSAELQRLTQVAEVVREARRVYGGNDAAAERFLTAPHRRLGDRPPIIVAASEAGAQAVRELLSRLEEGAPA